MCDFFDDGTTKGEDKETKERIFRVCADLAKRGIFIPRSFSFDLSAVSSIGIGGIAPAAFFPDTLAGLTELVGGLKRFCVPYAVLGSAANVLIPDGLPEKNSAEDADTVTEKGFLPGVIVFTKNLASLAVDGENIFAFAGVKGRDLVMTATAAGLTGAEFLTGIPCSVGGATYMNAGANGRHVSDAIESVLSYGTGEMRVRSVSECAFGYKDSVFMKNGEIILGVTFRLKREGVSLAEANVKIAAEARKNLPAGKSLGCIFKNPLPQTAGDRRISAGLLIEKAGWKGKREGGAKISEEHANFIINDGGATYENVKKLIRNVRRDVSEKQGVRLEEEIRYLGDLWQ